MDAREVTVHRVVNIVEKRSSLPRPGLDYDRGFHDDQWYGGPRNYQDDREFQNDGNYPPNDCQYFDENPNLGNFRRNSSPPPNEDPYCQPYYSRADLRHQLGSRSNGRHAPYFRQRGGGSSFPKSLTDRKAKEDRGDFRVSPPVVVTRDRSPVRREAHPPALGCSGSNTGSRNFTPDRDKGSTYQQAQQRHKSNLLTSHTPSSSVEVSPHSSGSSKEKTSASVAESEEVVAASMEPKSTLEEDLKARRLEAIKAKALEIEKHYRQDCETFRTVVKMLVAKEPSLENLLQVPLDKNLLEIKEHCLDALRHFVKELDEVLVQPDASVQDGSQNTGVTL